LVNRRGTRANGASSSSGYGSRRGRARRGSAVAGVRRRGDRVHGHGDTQFRRGRRDAGQHVRHRGRGRVGPGRRLRSRRRRSAGERRRRRRSDGGPDAAGRAAAVVRGQAEVLRQDQGAQGLPEAREDRQEKRSAV